MVEKVSTVPKTVLKLIQSNYNIRVLLATAYYNHFWRRHTGGLLYKFNLN